MQCLLIFLVNCGSLAQSLTHSQLKRHWHYSCNVPHKMALSNSHPCLFLTKDSCFLDPVQERRSWELQVLRCGRDGQHGAGELSKTSERVILEYRHKYVLWAGRWLFGSEWRWPKILAVLQILSTTAATSSPRTQGQRTQGQRTRRDKWHLGKITHLRPLSNLKDFETTSWDKEPKILWTESNSTFN